jgi:hypothetical protein
MICYITFSIEHKAIELFNNALSYDHMVVLNGILTPNVIWLGVGIMYKYGSFSIPYTRVNLLHKFSSF